MQILKRISKVFLHQSNLLLSLDGRGYLKLPDKLFLKMMFKRRMGYKLNLKNPQTFNEKLQYLKLYDRRPEYTIMVDKYAAKKYVADKIGEEYIIPTLGVWNKPEDINFDRLPNQFVLKCTHDSGTVIICKDKPKFDIKNVRKKLKKYLNQNYYLAGREWPYKNVPRRIIAEQYMEDTAIHELRDYKIFNFNGVSKLIQMDYNRFVKHMRKLYTPEWNEFDFELNYPADKNIKFDKPAALAEMLQLAKKLSTDIPFLRTDFYCINGKIYFGELTFYPEAGFGKFQPEIYDKKLGSWINIPNESGGNRRTNS